MTHRRRILATTLLTVSLAACGSSGSKPTASTTTSTTTGGTTFIEAVTALRAGVRAAGTDACKLRGVLESIGRTGDPKTRDDTRVAIAFIVDLYRAVAGSIERQSDAKLRASAPVWRTAADAVSAAGRKADYDPSALDTAAELGLPPDFADSSQAFGEFTKSCASNGN